MLRGVALAIFHQENLLNYKKLFFCTTKKKHNLEIVTGLYEHLVYYWKRSIFTSGNAFPTQAQKSLHGFFSAM